MKDPFTDLIKQSDVDLKVWNWIKWIFISVLIVVLISYLLFEYSKGNCSYYYDSIKENYKGKVVAKYFNKNDHMNKTIRLENGDIYTINFFDKTAFYDSIEIGNTVIKNKGSLKYYVVKNYDTLMFENMEADCNKYLKK
jgi:lipopolysaccharide export LptBFGC system permease protein LptF